MVELSLNQKNIIITRSKDKISDIKKLFTNGLDLSRCRSEMKFMAIKFIQ